jgi:hydroxyacylglutathione hydrolase
MTLSVITIPCLEDNYGYILRCDETEQTALIDAPAAAPLLGELKKRGWGLDHIFITHHDWDHIDGVAEIRAATGAAVTGASADAHRLPPLDHAVSDGDTIALGNCTAHVLDVSGHTIGHIAYWFQADSIVFSADSLMALGCGRLWEGTQPMAWHTLTKFIAMPPETLVYSGHEYAVSNAKFALTIEPDNAELVERVKDIETTLASGGYNVPASIALEMATNPFMRAGNPVMKKAMNMETSSDADVFGAIRTLKDNF